VEAPLGTWAVMSVSETTALGSGVPLKLTLVAPVKFVPWMSTGVPTGPLSGLNDVTAGSGPLEQPVNLNAAIRVCQLKLPLLGMYSFVYQNVQSSEGSTLMLV